MYFLQLLFFAYMYKLKWLQVLRENTISALSSTTITTTATSDARIKFPNSN